MFEHIANKVTDDSNYAKITKKCMVSNQGPAKHTLFFVILEIFFEKFYFHF